MSARHRKPSKTAKAATSVAVAGALTVAGATPALAAGGPRTEEIPVVVNSQPTRVLPGDSPTAHTVVSGDTLSDIAEAVGTTWPALFDANKAQIKDPHWIYPGQAFVLPGDVAEPGRVVVAPAAPKPPTAAMVVTPSKPAVVEAPKAALSTLVGSAHSYLGKGIQYVWGGKSLSQGFDCSGFVWQVLKDSGYKVPYRTSGSLKAWTNPVSKAEARAGDLVFWARGGVVYHVEIYLGNGKSLGAANPTIDIGIHNLHGSPTFGRIPV